MSIFNRDRSPTATPEPPRPRSSERPPSESKTRAATYVAAGCKVTGEITGSAEVLVDGVFEGLLDLESTVTVGREGRVQGEIRARAVRIEGRVTGNVRGSERVEVMASGTLEGDISASRVVIAEGAFFKGKVEMAGQKPAVAPARDAAPDTSREPVQEKAGTEKKPHQGEGQQQLPQGRSGHGSKAGAAPEGRQKDASGARPAS